MTKDSISFMEALEILDEQGYDYEEYILTRDDIALCAALEDWQEYRQDMKGLKTREKIEWLGDWYANSFKYGPDERYRRWVQITNYLNALKRGGQLK